MKTAIIRNRDLIIFEAAGTLMQLFEREGLWSEAEEVRSIIDFVLEHDLTGAYEAFARVSFEQLQTPAIPSEVRSRMTEQFVLLGSLLCGPAAPVARTVEEPVGNPS